MEQVPPLYALLIGIDQYDSRSGIPHLRGCVRDVEQMERLLRENFHVPADHIYTLTDAAATHDQIKTAFRTHLIGHAHQWAVAGRSAPPPAFLFHYSGHGSQAIDETGTEPDGLDETLVAYDSRTPNIYDIKDWELGQLIEELNAFTDNVTIVLDCCHSGSGTRDANIAQTRRCSPDLRPQPIAKQRPNLPAGKRSVSAGNWEIGEKHVLLAGCRDHEESNEYAIRSGARYEWQGAMSYFLQDELCRLSHTHATTYRELFERVRHAVNKSYPNQMPQCEGDIDREIFGGARPARDRFFNVIDRRDGLFWIDGGMAHGLTVESELKVYPPAIRTLAETDEPLAILQVVEEGAVESGCEILDRVREIPLHARCVIHRLNSGNMQRTVALAIGNEQLANAVEQRLQPQLSSSEITINDVSPWIAVADAMEESITEGGKVADFRIVDQSGALEIQDNSGTRLVAPFAPDDLDGLAADLAQLARYHNALELRNGAPSELAGAISIQVKQLGFDAETQQPIAIDLERSQGGELVIETGTRVVLEVTNHSDQALYFALFDFSPDWGVVQLYPQVQGAHEPLRAGGTFTLGLTNRRRGQLAAELPPNIFDAVERFKVIATVHDTNFELLQQDPLKSPFTTRAVVGVNGDANAQPSPLDELLGRAMNGNQRAFQIPPATIADEWATAEISLRVLAPVEDVTHEIQGNRQTVLPAYGVTVDAPAAFQGRLRILTEQQATRSLQRQGTIENHKEPPSVPPGLAHLGSTIQPLAFGNRRATATAGTVVELEMEGNAHRAITAETPLKLHLDGKFADTTQIVAVAYADGLFYPVGRSDTEVNDIAIEWLPGTERDEDFETATAGHKASNEEALASRRSVGRVLKLYLYKMVGWQEQTLGLHQVRYLEPAEVATVALASGEFLREFEGGAILYSPIDATTILPRQRIALAVHGFSADTKSIAIWLTKVLPQHQRAYDLVLAYDYESFATEISENGRILADALRSIEIDIRPRLRVDIFAHSMGTLVTRAMIELWGGDQFIERCFLAGPPNQGTRLADAKKLVPWLAALALNGIGNWTPAAIAGWALQKVEADAIGAEDLRPSSRFLGNINQSTKPVHVRYFILAGINAMLPQQDETVIERLQRHTLQGVDLALDTIFGEQNDLVISVGSMMGLRNGTYPPGLLKTREVPCHHFAYFSDQAAQQQLLAWLMD